MTHPDDLLADYVDGHLGERERAEVDAHLATCERCRADVRSARLAKERMAAVPPAEVPPRLAEDVLDAVRRERAPHEAPVVDVFGGRPASRRSSKPAAWLGAIAAAAAIVIGFFVFNGLSGPSENATVSDREAGGGGVAAPAAGGGPATSTPFVVQPAHDYDEAGIEHLAAVAAGGRLPVPPTPFASGAGGDAATAVQCLSKGARLRGDERPIELIRSTFDGKPADLGVYRVPGSGSGPDRIVVWVVSTRDCSVVSFTQHLLQG